MTEGAFVANWLAQGSQMTQNRKCKEALLNGTCVSEVDGLTEGAFDAKGRTWHSI